MIEEAINALADEMKSLLQRAIGFQSISGQEGAFCRFLAEWAAKKGFAVDLWQAREEELPSRPEQKHIPLAGRPTLVIRRPGTNPKMRSLIFNAHADVVSASDSEKWVADPWSGKEIDGRIYGRGACDVKGGLVSALWALSALSDKSIDDFGGEIIVEVIPGEEDCVGLGTMTSLVRGYTADAAIVVEPTESMPRNASRGGCRFEITALGKAVHGTVKWLGQDAIVLMRKILESLDLMEKKWNSYPGNEAFRAYPILRPVTVDSLKGGQWQGMVCDRCTCAGYLELLPEDDREKWKGEFHSELLRNLKGLGVLETGGIEIRFSEQYDGHYTSPESKVCQIAEQSVLARIDAKSRWNGWLGFNSGCEAGVRWTHRKTPTLVWGPGSLAQAHAVDEYVEFTEVQQTALLLARFAAQWCGTVKDV